MTASGGQLGERIFFAVNDIEGIVRIEVVDVAVFDVDTRNTVIGGGHDKGFVETDIDRAWANFRIPIDVAVPEAYVPFANDRAGIPDAFEGGGEGQLVGGYNHRGVAAEDAGPGIAPRVVTCEDAVAGWGAGGGSGVELRKANALVGQAVQIRGGYAAGTVATEIAES